MDLIDEFTEKSIVGRVDDDDVEIPFGAMPPDPDDGDNLPSQVHPSFPYGNPFKDKRLRYAAQPTHSMSTRALYEDGDVEGLGLKAKRRWKDIGLDMLLPADPVNDEEAKAKAARNQANAGTRPADATTTGPGGDENEGQSGVTGVDEPSNFGSFEFQRSSPVDGEDS